VLIINPIDSGFDFQFEPEGTISFRMDGSWFGHGELIHQRLPLNRLMIPLSRMMTYDNGPAGQSCNLTPAWYSSSGVLIFSHSPLSVGINQPPKEYPSYEWSLGADKGPFAHRPFEDPADIGDGLLTLSGLNLHLSLICKNDAVECFHHLLSMTGHPHDLPPDELFIKPTWTTWAQMKTDVTEEKVLQFADQIINKGYPYGVMEIDDRWQSLYGDLEFDKDKFPEPRRMIDGLHSRGFKVTAWVIPFINPESATYKEGAQKGYFVQDHTGEPYLVRWWQGIGGLLDVTNEEALNWFQNGLNKLQQSTGLDGFKFDAGEGCFLPDDAVCSTKISPNEYTQKYIQFIGRHFELTEVRSGWLNQPEPLFFRQWDKSSTWGADNGLHSVVTGMLSLGLTGYPFILPDMVCGNAYDDLPNVELMIRWTQVNALLPAMQFSIPPWNYSEECNLICRQYAWMHVEYSKLIISLARDSVLTGEPIIRPIWWLSPRDETALGCDDEFLVGNDLLVAPVLTPEVRARNIYLPAGKWMDIRTNEIFDGTRLEKQYPAPLEVLPVFKRVG
jgi:alpha-glucosidase (family GH31 glycosyl hydrolase)